MLTQCSHSLDRALIFLDIIWQNCTKSVQNKKNPTSLLFIFSIGSSVCVSVRRMFLMAFPIGLISRPVTLRRSDAMSQLYFLQQLYLGKVNENAMKGGLSCKDIGMSFDLSNDKSDHILLPSKL